MEKECSKTNVEEEVKDPIDSLCEQLNDFSNKIFVKVDYLKKRIEVQEKVIAKQGDKILELERELKKKNKADSGIVLLR